MTRSQSRERRPDARADGREPRKRSRSPARAERQSLDAKRPRRSRSRDREVGARDPANGRAPESRDREERGPDRERDRERARDREADRDRDRGRDRDRERDSERDRLREPRERDYDRDRDRERGRDRDRDRGREREREDWPRDNRDRDRDRSRGQPPPHTDKGDEDANGSAEASANGAAAAKKVEPLSLEELLKKKVQEKEQETKPTFLSKKQREELALKRREEEAATQKAKAEQMRSAHQTYVEGAERERLREAERRAQEERRRRDQERERAKELELIKRQYLGGEKVRKKVLRPSEKFRFNFDWEAADDTSRDLNPLYNATHEARLLFGRGLRAGADRREQKKALAEAERQRLKKAREQQGITETREDRRADAERTRAAAAYDEFNFGRVEKHWTEKARDEMTERDWRIFREDFSISYKGVSASATALPIRNWEEAGLAKPLMKAIEKLGYKKPSPIQMAAIPMGLQQRDVIGVAETGSGKTAAFVLPMLTYIMRQPIMTEEVAAEGPYAVVMAPTRELAQQIEEETVKLATFTEYRMVSVVGGQSIEDQGFKLRKGCEIVIATPGRLLDCLEQRYAVLNQCNYVVLDEADRMIDLGFEPQVMGVLDAMPSSNLKPEGEEEALDATRVYRTTYMFSATMPPAVERLARKYLRRPVVVNIGSAGKATDNVQQIVLMAKDNDKPRLLEEQLEAVDERRAIVFVNTKRNCDVVSKHLDHLGFRCIVLHGGKTQDQREAGLAGFREEKYNVLVATDVAGRGIDVPDVAAVINYDMPHSIEQYTHRIGRTGRAGRKGAAITFLTLSDTEVFYDLKKLLEESGAAVPSQLAYHEAAKTKPGSITDRPRREQTVYIA